MSDANTAQLIAVLGIFMGLVVTVVGFVLTYLRDVRNRRWDLEDRASARKELDQKIRENTELTRQAASKEVASTATLGAVEKTGKDTNRMVSDLKTEAEIKKDE